MSAARKINKSPGMLGKVHETSTKIKISAKKLEQPKVQCPHCNIIGDKAALFRWHFNNCKSIT